MIPKNKHNRTKWASRIFAALFTMLLASSMMTTQTFAQTGPQAGAQIGNQATATFDDAGGNTRTVTSNVVNTVVLQVAAVAVESPLTKQVSPGGQITFPFTITNNGNGDDTFTLNLVQQAGDDFDLNNLQVFADADGNGVPDDNNDLNGSSTPNIAAGNTFNVVVVGTAPNGATSTQQSLIDLDGVSDFDNTVTDNVTGTAIISEDAVVSVTKSMSQTTGQPGETRTVTLTFSNSGNTAASDIEITDNLAVEFVYQAGTGAWSEAPGGPITDTDGASDDASGISYDFNSGTSTVTATIASLNPGQSGTVSFDVNVAAGTPPGTIENTAVFEYNDGNSQEGPFNSNTVIFTVAPALNVTIAAQNSPIAAASQGGSVNFNNLVTNTGNAQDAYDIELSTSTYPAGTSFILFKPDGVSPLLDTDGNGVPDTGPISPSGTFNVVVKVDLPSGVSSGGPFTVDVTATSTTDAGVNDVTVDELTAITGNTVDLTANNDINNNNSITVDDADAADGLNPDDLSTASDVQTVDPGQTAQYTLFVNNTSSVSDNFDLSASDNNTFPGSLPSGVSVDFEDTNGSTITNTGTINASSSKEVIMKISFPSTQPAGLEDFFVRAISPSTSASDKIRVDADINTIRDISLAPNNSGQVFPGSSVLYTHTLTNNGNVTENPGSDTNDPKLTLTSANSNTGFNTVLYLDSNENGEIDSGEPIISDASNIPALSPGQSVQILAKVSAAPGAQEGLNNTTTVTAAVTGNISGVVPPADAQATDLTTVINSNVVVSKRQALDANANGALGDPSDGTLASTDINAEPGQGIFYEVVVSNQGTDPISQVTLDDAVPSFTSLITGSESTTKGTITITSGVLNVDVGQLNPGESATLTFAVEIDSN